MSGEVLVFELKPQPWMRQANCVDADPALFFPERGEPSSPAKAICLACPVRVECLNYALSINERHGIWGGTSENERRVLRRQWTGTRRRRGPPTPTGCRRQRPSVIRPTQMANSAAPVGAGACGAGEPDGPVALVLRHPRPDRPNRPGAKAPQFRPKAAAASVVAEPGGTRSPTPRPGPANSSLCSRTGRERQQPNPSSA